MQDDFGRTLVMTDSDALHFDNGGTENYYQLGLVSGGLAVDVTSQPRNYQVTSLEEDNAKQLLKSEGSFGLGVKGYTWNSAVTKPNDAALALVTNWTRVADLGHKDVAGVRVVTL